MFCQHKENAFKDAIKVLIDIRIVAPKYTVAEGLEIFGSLFIISDLMIITMGDTINLNHQPRFITDEIDNVIPYRYLAIEFPALQPFGSQITPEPFFGFSLIAA